MASFWKSLTYYWKIQLAVLAGTAVTSAVLTGALIVGDSLKGSLKDLTLNRLGKIDHALVSQHFVREELASKLPNTAPAILISGSAVSANTKQRASQIAIHGINDSFLAFFDSKDRQMISTALQRSTGQLYPPVVINEALQKELDVKENDELLLSFEKKSAIHRESVLGARSPEETIRSLRVTVKSILPSHGLARGAVANFGLLPNQYVPRNAFLSLKDLQRALDQKSRVNALYTSGPSPQEKIGKLWNEDDFGWIMRSHENVLSLESREIILKPEFVAQVQEVAKELRTSSIPVFTYLANRIEANNAITPYSTMAAFDIKALPRTQSLPLIKGEVRRGLSENLVLTNGNEVEGLADGQILVNDWLAEDLKIQQGQDVTISYFKSGTAGDLSTEKSTLRVAGIVKQQGLAADATLTPEYPGIQNVSNISEWSPPFPVDLTLIRPKDEEYWDAYRATPKAFISLSTGQKLWSSRFGNATSVRVVLPSNIDPSKFRSEFISHLLKRFNAAQAGMFFQPVKEQGLQAAAGSTDFGMLFLGFSLFLILSSALLVGLLFRLGAEQRASELGLLFATGYPLKKARGLLLKEGGIIAGTGTILGVFLAVSYSWALIVALQSWWVAAIGTRFLQLHIQPLSVIIGSLSAFLVCILSVILAVRKLVRFSPVSLLAGSHTSESRRSGRFTRILAPASLILSIGLILAAFRATSPAPLFFGAGFCMLTAGLSFFRIWIRSSHRKWKLSEFTFSRFLMSARNTSRNPGRSLLSIALVSSACFVLVAVGANRKDIHKAVFERDSGNGGFSLLAQSDVSLQHDLNSGSARLDLGMNETEPFSHSRIYNLRLLPGDDISCLNLYQPKNPRILGVPDSVIQRGGFRFQQTSQQKENPWVLLDQDLGPDVIPAIGDFNSVQWILHLSLNDTIAMKNDQGKPIRVKIVGLLQESIFQSELLISEKNFVKHFPSQSGFSFFLVETPVEKRATLARTLETSLEDYGFDAIPAEDRLASYKAVENTYISTFQTLGGLGMLLGTLGLGIILIRNVLERRGELASLRAFGFRKSTLLQFVLMENAFLLMAGMLIGSLSAALAVAPYIVQQASAIPWGSLGITLLLILITGMMSSIAAVSAALRIPLLPALKSL